jgi:E3 ubiquitin-protein ligase TRIP12
MFFFSSFFFFLFRHRSTSRARKTATEGSVIAGGLIVGTIGSGLVMSGSDPLTNGGGSGSNNNGSGATPNSIATSVAPVGAQVPPPVAPGPGVPGAEEEPLPQATPTGISGSGGPSGLSGAGGTAAAADSESDDGEVGRLQALLEARGLPPHVFGALGSRMQHLLNRSMGASSGKSYLFSPCH